MAKHAEIFQKIIVCHCGLLGGDDVCYRAQVGAEASRATQGEHQVFISLTHLTALLFKDDARRTTIDFRIGDLTPIDFQIGDPRDLMTSNAWHHCVQLLRWQ